VEVIVRKAVALLFVILIVACKAERAAPASTDEAAQVTGVAAARTDNRSAFTKSATPQLPRMIVRTAEMRIIVGDTTKTVDAVTRSVEAMGGYVAGSNIWREGELLRATLRLRVPSDKLTSTLASIRGLAERVDNETIASEDVSQEFVDLESQVRNLEATEAELRALLTVARERSKKAADVLEVHQQLTLIRGQIEQSKGRMRYLSQVASMSGITLEVMPNAIAKPVIEPGWQPTVIAKDAVRALLEALQSFATVSIWVIVYVVPIFGMLALFIVALWKVARRVRTAREA
jgi:hypothetical protein